MSIVSSKLSHVQRKNVNNQKYISMNLYKDDSDDARRQRLLTIILGIRKRNSHAASAGPQQQRGQGCWGGWRYQEGPGDVACGQGMDEMSNSHESLKDGEDSKADTKAKTSAWTGSWTLGVRQLGLMSPIQQIKWKHLLPGPFPQIVATSSLRETLEQKSSMKSSGQFHTSLDPSQGY